jgi:lysyl-tRNA synthetase class 2
LNQVQNDKQKNIGETLIFENQYIQERIKKAAQLREEGFNPYPTNIEKGMSSKDFLEKYAYIAEQEAEEKKDNTVDVTLTGRLKFIRIMGKAAFAKMEDSLKLYLSLLHLYQRSFTDFKTMSYVTDNVTLT